MAKQERTECLRLKDFKECPYRGRRKIKDHMGDVNYEHCLSVPYLWSIEMLLDGIDDNSRPRFGIGKM